MTTTHWLEIPIRQPIHEGAPVDTKYEVGDAVVVYSNDSAYVGLGDRRAAEALLVHQDVRALGDREVDRTKPVPGLSLTLGELEHQVGRLRKRSASRHATGLGDAIAFLTRRLGVRECGSCARRHRNMNRVRIWGWWREGKIGKFMGNATAIVRQRDEQEAENGSI
ncbi:hypothetical protein [Streptomyces capillispiralis]|uniref:hypothetical protein n=1 Tax=Streptomyces capillispiralis TaxID=68182 RepID=UPI0011A2B180|nr:hypothetical protein [Streptomyces capillispiralis]GHH94065.1 hypothetical protein GCM10017779_45220 [Streptomyces capillispiralis]